MKPAIGAMLLLLLSGAACAHSTIRDSQSETAPPAPQMCAPSPATALSFFFSALLVLRGRRPRGPR